MASIRRFLQHFPERGGEEEEEEDKNGLRIKGEDARVKERERGRERWWGGGLKNKTNAKGRSERTGKAKRD